MSKARSPMTDSPYEAKLKKRIAELEAELTNHKLGFATANEEREALEAEVERLRESEAYWQEEAKRYCGNADYWREKYEAIKETE
jgi:FtsZ-binding cell division protein ZapB